MQVGDVVTFARQFLNSVGVSSARFSDTVLINFCDRGAKWVMSDILFPSSRITITAIPNQQLYSLPELYTIERVYVNGTPIPPADLDTLEGNQIGSYDATGVGAPIAGSDAPYGAGGVAQPQWTIQSPMAYPFTSNWGAPAPLAQPWFPGQRARYYTRGGQIGLVPAPGNAASIVVEGVIVPAKVQNLTDNLVVPDNFTEAIAWRIAVFALLPDPNASKGTQTLMFAKGCADEELRKLRTWKRQYTGNNTGPKVQTYRGYYRIGGRTNGDWGLG